MNWETIGFIFIYCLLGLFFIGICVYVCIKDHLREAGTEYERLSSVELIPKDDRPVVNL